MIRGHGNNIADFEGKLISDFSSNVIQNEHTDAILHHLKTRMPVLNNYPEAEYRELRKHVAQYHSIAMDNIWPTNGSTEAFYLLAHAFRGQKTAIIIPAFSEYEDACKLYQHQISYKKDLQSCTGHDLVWIGNPNNPNGTYYSHDILINFLEDNPHTTLIVDEAYLELCPLCNSMVEFVKLYKNLVVIKSFTKLFAIPGLRIGYALASPHIITRLQSLHMPWAVNALAVEASMYILEHYHTLIPNIDTLIQTSKELQHTIDGFHNYSVTFSDTIFFLVKLEKERACDFQRRMINEHGILIRDASNFRGLDAYYIRLAVRDTHSAEQLLRALS